MLQAQWNIGWLIGMYILIFLQLIGVVVFAGAIGGYLIGDKNNPDRGSITVPAAFISGTWIIIVGIIGTVVAFPFSGAYHRYVPISGTISQTVQSRFLSDGSGSTQNYLVVINNRQYRCDDTRCAGLVKGTKLTLMCEKSFQFNATSGWVCNWGKLGLNAVPA
jgi:hypothetical protein